MLAGGGAAVRRRRRYTGTAPVQRPANSRCVAWSDGDAVNHVQGEKTVSRELLSVGLAGLVALSALGVSAPTRAENPTPYPDTVVTPTRHSYSALVERLDTAIQSNELGIVARASATLGAKSIGVEIPGNMVVMVFHPRYAVRMLAASVAAGIEAPIRFYITENDDGSATLTYRTPSSVFNPYENAELDAMAEELDASFARIAQQATAD